MQKKVLAILLILTMVLTFAACGGSDRWRPFACNWRSYFDDFKGFVESALYIKEVTVK